MVSIGAKVNMHIDNILKLIAPSNFVELASSFIQSGPILLIQGDVISSSSITTFSHPY